MIDSSPLSLASATLLLVLAACGPSDDRAPSDDSSSASRPDDVPALHHVGLNTTDPDRAIAWYLSVWPTAQRTEMNGRPAVSSEMYLVFNTVEDAPGGAFDPELGRPMEQSAFWHIGAFANTTDSDRTLGEVGVEHLPLFTGPTDPTGVWRSGLTPYAGILAADAIPGAEPAEPRPGGFSYVLAPDGVLFEVTGGPNTTASMSHVHFFHEAPRCAANWYVDHMGMALPPVRNDDGSTSAPPPYEPCDAPIGEAGWPSLERQGTIREPRGTVVHGSGSMSWYPRQCVADRCDRERPLVPSRGQALDHVAFSVTDLDAWYEWLTSRGVTILEAPHSFDDGRAFMIEGPDRLAIEVVEAG